MSWSWRELTEPSIPMGVVGAGDAARRLFAAVEQMDQAASSGLMATASDGILVLTGAAHILPWADGVQYIAPCAEAAALWLPTAECPETALDLLERAIHRKHRQQPLLMLREPPQLVPLTRLMPVNAPLLRQIRERWCCD